MKDSRGGDSTKSELYLSSIQRRGVGRVRVRGLHCGSGLYVGTVRNPIKIKLSITKVI